MRTAAGARQPVGAVRGVQHMLRGAADGSTLFYGSNTTLAANASLMKKPPYKAVKDFAPLTPVRTLPFLLVITSDNHQACNQRRQTWSQGRSSSANDCTVGLRFMVHAPAQVAFEERGQWVPGWKLRFAYRPLIGLNASRFERAMRQYLAAHISTGK